MKHNFRILALVPLSVIGLALLGAGDAVEDQERPDPCPGSFAIYVDGDLVECMDSEQRYKAYP